MARRRKNDWAELCAEIRASGDRGPGRRYGADLRRRICAYARGEISRGASLRSVAGSLDMSEQTLSRWLTSTEASMLPVVVQDESESSTSRGITIRCPGGLIVEGLHVDELAVLLRAMAPCSG